MGKFRREISTYADSLHKQLSDPARVEHLLTYGVRPRYDRNGRKIEARWLPHQGKREIARRQGRDPSLFAAA